MKRVPVFYEYEHGKPIGDALINEDGIATILIPDKEVVKILQGDNLVALSLMGIYQRRHTAIIERVDGDEKRVSDKSTSENVILLGVNITSSSPEPKEIIKRAMRELELTFGDAVKFAFSEIKPK